MQGNSRYPVQQSSGRGICGLMLLLQAATQSLAEAWSNLQHCQNAASRGDSALAALSRHPSQTATTSSCVPTPTVCRCHLPWLHPGACSSGGRRHRGGIGGCGHHSRLHSDQGGLSWAVTLGACGIVGCAPAHCWLVSCRSSTHHVFCSTPHMCESCNQRVVHAAFATAAWGPRCLVLKMAPHPCIAHRLCWLHRATLQHPLLTHLSLECAGIGQNHGQGAAQGARWQRCGPVPRLCEGGHRPAEQPDRERLHCAAPAHL